MQTLPPPVDELIGKTLGQYDIEQLLGYGNVNAVYAAQQQPQNRAVMLTTFMMPETFSLQARERFMTRFTQEASTLVRLNHPHILPIYDFGEQFGYPYLVTPFVAGDSLAKLLKQENRCTPERVLPILKQIAEGLDYAHKNGIVHGTLKPANVLLDSEQGVQITGFGLVTLLKMQGIEQIEHPYAHLISIAGTFLGAPEYTAPEVVQGAPLDDRSDVYSLGVMLFELLAGRPPFTGSDPFAIALQHVQQPVPSLQTFSSDMLPGLDLVIQRALERDPAQRFQSAAKLADAFERVLSVIQGAAMPTNVTKPSTPAPPEMTMPPTVNWFDEEIASHENWQVKPPALTGYMPAVGTATTAPKLQAETGPWQLRPPIVTGRLPSVEAPAASQKSSLLHYAKTPATPDTATEKKDVDPFVWWSTGTLPEAQPGTFKKEKKKSSKKADAQEKPANKSRRRAIAMIATGGVVAAGVLGAGGLGLAHFLQKSPTTVGQTAAPATTQKTTTQGNTPTQKQGTGKGQPPAPKKQPPATQPPKAPQPTHTGTVIGMQNQGINSANAFTNPTDGNGSLLVHLPNGNFAAYESACTHEGVTVKYNPNTQKFVCPRHGAIFDPAQNGKVLQGPADMPLPAIKVRINGDGTVTTG